MAFCGSRPHSLYQCLLNKMTNGLGVSLVTFIVYIPGNGPPNQRAANITQASDISWKACYHRTGNGARFAADYFLLVGYTSRLLLEKHPKRCFLRKRK